MLTKSLSLQKTSSFLSLRIWQELSKSMVSRVVNTPEHLGHVWRRHLEAFVGVYLLFVVLVFESHNKHTMSIYCAYADKNTSGKRPSS
jgi:hypothetical protein